MLKKVFFTVFFCTFFCSIFSQEMHLPQKESELKLLFEKLNSDISDNEKSAVNEQLTHVLKTTLSLDEAFDFAFDSLVYLGKIYATDRKIRIFTWNFATQTGWRFSCLVQQKSGEIFEFSSKKSYEPKENEQIFAKNWYGAVYYEAIPTKIGKKHAYTLLGWQQTKPNYQTKIIDILVLEKEPYFGEKIIENSENELVCRRLFCYDNQVVMNLFYEKNSRRIVFDHLSPIRLGAFLDETTFGPDMSVDCLQFKSKKWRFNADIRAKNE